VTSSDIYLSQEAYDKFVEELAFLKTKRRRELAKEVGEARSHGDISENAEYDAAKEAQGLNEKQIAELEEKLSRARIIDDTAMEKDKAYVGAILKLKDLSSNEQIEYVLVSEMEADFAQGKISITSPVGKGLLGHKKGDTVEITVPAGTLKYKILDVSR